MLMLITMASAHQHDEGGHWSKQPFTLPHTEACPLLRCNAPFGRITNTPPGPAFRRVPIRNVAPRSWLLEQLVLQANGMSGWYRTHSTCSFAPAMIAISTLRAPSQSHTAPRRGSTLLCRRRYQPLFYPLINQSAWFGGPRAQSAAGQWATYWLNGNVPLATLLRNAGAMGRLPHNLGAITDRYIDYIMTAQNATTGQLGPDECSVADPHGHRPARGLWPFPTLNAIRSMLFAAESTEDPARIAALNASMARGLTYLLHCTSQNLSGWGQRWPSGVEGLQEYTDAFPPPIPSLQPQLAKLGALWRQTGSDWDAFYRDDGSSPAPLPHSAVLHPSHVRERDPPPTPRAPALPCSAPRPSTSPLDLAPRPRPSTSPLRRRLLPRRLPRLLPRLLPRGC